MSSSCEVRMKKLKGNDRSDALKVNSCKSFGSDTSKTTIAKVIQYPSKREVATSSSDCSRSASASEEYYKKYYDYDIVPVKDSVTSQTSTVSKEERLSLTESYLNKIEQNMSEELQTDCSTNTLDSNIKFFKVAVEEIFSRFYDNMHDFELYKKKFHEILSREQGDCGEKEMEDFIKDMIRHIMSSESVNVNADRDKADEKPDSSMQRLDDIEPVTEEFKNENYSYMESGSDEKGHGSKQECKDKVANSDTLNIYFMSRKPYLKIKMNKNNSHLSEIQIMEKSHQNMRKMAASADDMKMLSSKRMELAMIDSLAMSDNADREIPVKIAFAKKNIPCDEESHRESNRGERSFLSCLCSYLCKKLRKATNLGM